MSAGDCVQIFYEDKCVDGQPQWGWQCFSCGAEETGYGNASTAREAGDNHAALCGWGFPS